MADQFNSGDQFSPGTALISSVQAILSVTLAWISIRDAQVFIAILASIVACISGFLAARYYYYAGQEKKHIMKQHKFEEANE